MTFAQQYHEAINRWLKAHGKKTLFCLVQFQDVEDSDLPRIRKAIERVNANATVA